MDIFVTAKQILVAMCRWLWAPGKFECLINSCSGKQGLSQVECYLINIQCDEGVHPKPRVAEKKLSCDSFSLMARLSSQLNLLIRSVLTLSFSLSRSHSLSLTHSHTHTHTHTHTPIRTQTLSHTVSKMNSRCSSFMIGQVFIGATQPRNLGWRNVISF